MNKGREKTHQLQNINHQHNNQPHFAHSRPCTNAALQNENITGWDNQNILVQQNLNVFCNRLNNSKLKQKRTQSRKNAIRQAVRLGSAVDKERLSVGSRAKGRKASDNFSKNSNLDIVGSQNMDPLRHREITNLANEKCLVFTDNDQPKNQFQGQFSHIEVLKFEARHLERQEFTKGKFPTFSSLHQEGALAYSVSENSTRLENKSKSRQQQSQARRDGPTSHASHSHSSSHHAKPCSKFYKTLTSQWVNSKNPSLIIQPAFSSFNSSGPNNNGTFSSNGAHNWGTKQKQKEAQLLDFSCVLGTNLISGIANGPVAREQFKTIHWKKSRPFTKFFQSKKKKVGESGVNGVMSESGTPCKKGQGKGMKQIEGRKLYQLLTLNRQVIELEDF